MTALCTSSALAAESASPLALTFGTSSITVAGVEPGATVYIFGVAREAKGFRTNVVPREATLEDDDNDGRIQWELGVPLAWRSVWLAVELSNRGAYGAGSPPAYAIAKRIALTGNHLKHDAAGEIQGFAFNGSMVHVVAVRPKTKEVWGATILSRGALDEGREAGKVNLSTFRLERKAGTVEPAPKSLKNGDVLFILNSFRGEYGLAKAGER